MKLTLAMGLQYDPNPNLLSSGREGIATASLPSTASPTTEPVIDVEAIAIDPIKQDRLSANLKTFDFLVYDLRSSLVFLPVIGSQLNMTI